MIAIVAPNYHPETNAAAKRITAFAERLAQRHAVTVVTLLPHYPQNRLYDGFDVETPFARKENGVGVVRLRPWIVSKANLPKRLAAESAFCLIAMTHLVRRRPRLVIASSPFMFLGPLGLAASRMIGARFAWDVRDLTWLYPRATGRRTLGTDRLIERLMLATARRSDMLTTATEGLLSYFRERPERAMVAVNGVNDELLDSLLELREPATDAPTNVLYAGLFGYNHALATLLAAAELLPDIAFTLAGDGPERAELEQMARRKRLRNVQFVGYLSREELMTAYARSTILVSHVRKSPLYRWTQPAKLWEYMATGRPTIHAGEGEVVDIIRDHDIGVAVRPEDASALAEAIRLLATDRCRGLKLGRQARSFVSSKRRRTTLLHGLESMWESVLLEACVASKDPRKPLR